MQLKSLILTNINCYQLWHKMMQLQSAKALLNKIKKFRLSLLKNKIKDHKCINVADKKNTPPTVFILFTLRRTYYELN